MMSVQMKSRTVLTEHVVAPERGDALITIECLAKEIMMHILECGDASYSFKWCATTALMLCNKHMADMVTTWRSNVWTLNFLPKWEKVFHRCDNRKLNLNQLSRASEVLKRKYDDVNAILMDIEILKRQMFMSLWCIIIRKFPNLITLRLPNFELSDDELKKIVSLTPKLTTLDLGTAQDRLTDAASEILCTHLPDLTALKLRSTQLTNSFVATLGTKCKAMEALMLYSCSDVSDEGLTPFVNKESRLRALELTDSKIKDEVISSLVSTCTNLESINLSYSDLIHDLTPQSVTTACVHLKSLKLSGCTQLTDSAFRDIGKCSKLHTLHVNRCKELSNSALVFIAKCSNLRTLEMSECVRIDDDGIACIAEGCGYLETIVVASCSKITNEGVNTLARRCPMLEYVDLSALCKITYKAFAWMNEKCPRMKVLKVGRCKGVGVEALRLIAKCKRLEVLDIHKCGNVRDSGVIDVAHNCRFLKRICFDYCSDITNVSIHALSLKTPYLEYVSLIRCNNITDSSILLLMISCPNLKHLLLYQCTNISNDILEIACAKIRDSRAENNDI
jgi:F-box/leucine-rich repeat protein 2/20